MYGISFRFMFWLFSSCSGESSNSWRTAEQRKLKLISKIVRPFIKPYEDFYVLNSREKTSSGCNIFLMCCIVNHSWESQPKINWSSFPALIKGRVWLHVRSCDLCNKALEKKNFCSDVTECWTSWKSANSATHFWNAPGIWSQQNWLRSASFSWPMDNSQDKIARSISLQIWLEKESCIKQIFGLFRKHVDPPRFVGNSGDRRESV